MSSLSLRKTIAFAIALVALVAAANIQAAPTATVTPADGAASVGLATTIQVTFDDGVAITHKNALCSNEPPPDHDVGSDTYTCDPYGESAASLARLAQQVTLRDGGVGGSDIAFDVSVDYDTLVDTLTVTPSGTLPPGKQIYFALGNGFWNFFGEQFAGLTATFTTESDQGPTASFGPESGILESATTPVTVTFSEAVYSDASGTAFTNETLASIISVKWSSLDGRDFDVNVTLTGATATITPKLGWAQSNYHIEVGDGYYNAGGTQGTGASASFVHDSGPLPVGVGNTVQHVVGDSTACLDVKHNDVRNGQPVWAYTCNGTAAQNWMLEKRTAGDYKDSYRLRYQGKEMCLDNRGDFATSNRMGIWSCVDDTHGAVANQSFTLTPSDGGHILTFIRGSASSVMYTDRTASNQVADVGQRSGGTGPGAVWRLAGLPTESLTVAVGDTSVAEAAGAQLAFVVELSRAALGRDGTVSVAYATSDGTATSDLDYTSASGTLTFSPGESRKTVNVTVLDDSLDDDGETLTFTLSSPVGATIATATGTGTITNSDPMPTAWIARFGRSVGESVVDAVRARVDASSEDGRIDVGAHRERQLRGHCKRRGDQRDGRGRLQHRAVGGRRSVRAVLGQRGPARRRTPIRRGSDGTRPVRGTAGGTPRRLGGRGNGFGLPGRGAIRPGHPRAIEGRPVVAHGRGGLVGGPARRNRRSATLTVGSHGRVVDADQLGSRAHVRRGAGRHVHRAWRLRGGDAVLAAEWGQHRAWAVAHRALRRR